MADISTAVSMARVPILGEDGRISDDYIPAAIGEGVESAEAAATRAETAATAAEGFATAASQSATDAQGSASAASASAIKAQQSATAASGAVTKAQSAQQAAEAAKTAAETAQSAAAGSAQDAQQSASSASGSASAASESASAAANSAASVADKFITSAKATTLEPGSQATASVEEQVLNVGIPKGDKGDKGDPGDDGHTPQRGVDYWTAEDVEAIVEDAKTQAVAELAEIGNVPKKTVTDLVAHGEDAYAQKPIEVRVKGKTWVNRWPSITVTQQGVMVTTDETGLITISGTNDTAADLYVYFGKPKGLAEGKQVTFTSTDYGEPGKWRFVLTNIGGSSGVTQKETFQIAKRLDGQVSIVITPGTTIDAKLRVMLVDGTETPDCFTPPASITSAQPENLVTSGKNLLPEDPFSISDAYLDCGVLPPGNYVLSFKNVTAWWETASNGNRIYPGPSYTTGIASFVMGNTAIGQRAYGTFTNPYTQRVVFTDFSDHIFVAQSDFMLELGSTATSYEPPTVTQTPLPEVELRSLPNGTCDELVIRADGTCEVERKTVQVTFDGSEDEGWRQYALNTSAFTASCFNFFADSPINIGTNQASAVSAVVCRELPVIAGGFDLTIPGVSVSHAATDRLYITAPSTVTDIDSFKQWLATNPVTCVVNVTGKPDEPQSPVTLPAIPAPTFNQYHDSPVPSDTSTEYVRDINIVIDNLAKQIAGTAATVAINEATR